MKKNAGRLSKKLFAAMMAGTMMTAMIGANVYATGGGSAPANDVEDAVVNVTKQITKEANVYAPDTDFTFVIRPAQAGELADGIEAGPANGIYFTGAEGASSSTGTISSAPDASDIGETTTTVGTAQIHIDTSEFSSSNPGIYRYVISETADSYEGLEYTTETKYFDVYVNNTDGVYAYTFVSKNNPKVKDNGIFTNDYSASSEEGGTKTLTVTKTISGNQASENDVFTINLSVNGDAGEKYYVVYGNNQNTTIESDAEEATGITLQADQTATIYGLSATDEVKVDEVDYTGEGYTATYTGTTGFTDTTPEGSESDYMKGKVTGDNAGVTITNTKNPSAPTGIAMTYGPYALMVALAGGMAVLFLRRRNREDY